MTGSLFALNVALGPVGESRSRGGHRLGVVGDDYQAPPEASGEVGSDFAHPNLIGGSMRLRKTLATLVAGAALVGAVASSAWAGGNGAQKVPLTTSLNYTCGGGAIGGAETKSFAVLNQHNGLLSAEIQIKDGTPNATYTVWVIQTPSGSDCGEPNATITTDANGHGSLHYSEPIIPGSTGAWVAAFANFGSDGHGYSASVTLVK